MENSFCINKNKICILNNKTERRTFYSVDQFLVKARNTYNFKDEFQQEPPLWFFEYFVIVNTENVGYTLPLKKAFVFSDIIPCKVCVSNT